MKRLSILCLASALLALAPSARAELRYLVYDLKAQAATSETVSDPRDATYRNGTQILFVQDPDISTDYYIGAFEVTQAQAATLGWRGAKAGGQAYTATTATEIATLPALPANLSFQTVAQWQAYAGEPTKPCNVSGGTPEELSFFGYEVPVETWYEGGYAAVTDPDNGAFDLYGNALEYTAEGRYIGGCAARTGYQFNRLNKEGETIRDKVPTDSNGRGLLGVRLVYTPPEAQTFTVTVTMNGKQVGEPEGHKPGETVTVTPQVPAGHALTRREVTPEGLDEGAALEASFSFKMPAQNVTVAYTSKPYATITVEGGTAALADGTAAASLRAFAGNAVTLTPREPGNKYEAFERWEVPEGVILGEGNVFTVPDDIQGGEEYTFTATFEITPHATIVVVGGTASASEAVAGETVTLTPREPGKYEEFAGWDAPEGTTVKDNAFTVPTLTEDVTYTFTARFETIPHATIVVVGGTASAYEAVAGETVTLTPPRAAPPYQAFTGWGGPEVKDNVFTVPELSADVTYTFTATYQYYPRVLVSGGSAVVTNGRQAFGNGYYEPGASLTLTPDKVEGRTFTGWEGAEVGLNGNAYTVGGYGTAVTLTATYEEAKAETPDPVTIRLGSDKTLFGNRVDKASFKDASGNIYEGFFYSAADLYASLPLTGSDRTIAYSNTLPTASAGSTEAPERPDAPELPATEEELKDYQEALERYEKALAVWASGATQSGKADVSKLTLRRVTPSSGKAFYLGVYETTIGHVVNLEKVAGRTPNSKWSATSHATFCVYNLKLAGDNPQQEPDFEGYLSIISDKFGVSARFPQIDDVKAVGDAYRDENPGAGYGPGGNPADSKISDGAVVSSGTPKAADGMEVDPYGFYGLWGNCYEALSNNTGFAGSVNEKYKHFCITGEPVSFATSGYLQYASFRPLIEVEDPVTLFVGSAKGPYVQVAPGEKLFPDESATPAPTQEGKAFQGWKLGGQPIGTNYVVEAEDEGKVLAATWKDVPSVRDVTVTCVNCQGPGNAVVGGTITVYPPEGHAFVADKPVTLSGATSVVKSQALRDGAVTLTLKVGALDEPAALTITGKTVELAQPRPGYRLILR